MNWSVGASLPENDLFEDRVTVSGSRGEVTGDNTFATVEPGEPGGHVALASTWYEWTATSNGYWRFNVNSVGFGAGEHTVQVYKGESVKALRLLSDTRWYPAIVSVERGETYQIAVTSWLNDPQGAYSLSWRETSIRHLYLIANDMFEDAEVLSGESGTGEKCVDGSVLIGVCFTEHRSVEPNEPATTNSHSQWWIWEAPTKGTYTWRIEDPSVDTLSLFKGGDELEELDLAGSGSEISVSIDDDEPLYVASHRNPGLDFVADSSLNTIVWGPTPQNDRIGNAVALEGIEGETTLSLKYATTTFDETVAGGIAASGVNSSVWWTWVAPNDLQTGSWMKFSLEDWEEAGLTSKTNQYFLGIYRIDRENGKYDLVASTDRSYIGSGRAEAIFKPVEGTEYSVQVALRSSGRAYSDDQYEVTFNWAETTAPAWVVHGESTVEIGSTTGDDMLELSDPKGITLGGKNEDRLLISVTDGILHLRPDEGGDLHVVETIPLNDIEGNPLQFFDSSVLAWSPTRQAMYVAHEEGFSVYEGLDQSNRGFSNCSVEDDFSAQPLQLIVGHSGRYLYKVASGTVAMYRIDGPCEISLVNLISSSFARHLLKTRDSSLNGLGSVAIDNTDSYMYGISNDYLLVFSRDEDNLLSLAWEQRNSTWLRSVGVSTLYRSRFDSAKTVVDSSGSYLFGIGIGNASAVVFDLEANKAEPTELGATTLYHISASSFFPSHIRKPRGINVFPAEWWDLGSCSAFANHNRNHVAVDVFCEDRTYVATWDKELEELFISDWSTDLVPDRFGNSLPTQFEYMDSSLGVQSKNGNYAFVVVEDWIDSIHRFERVSGAKEVVEPGIEPYEPYIVRLVALDVSPGNIELGSRSFSECETVDNLDVDDVTYSVTNSKWQSRTELGAEWADVEGTVRTDNMLCPYSPEDNKDYRLASEMTIDDEIGKYSSNVMAVPTDN